MDIMTHAKFYFNRLMLTLIFAIWASEPPPGPGERLKRPGLIGLRLRQNFSSQITVLESLNFDLYLKSTGKVLKKCE